LLARLPAAGYRPRSNLRPTPWGDYSLSTDIAIPNDKSPQREKDFKKQKNLLLFVKVVSAGRYYTN